MISKLKKSDIRQVGSGNPGTLNMSRNFGLKFGLLTLFLDMLKGLIPAIVGFFAVLGHIYPVFYKFKGGKGIATTIGVFLASSVLTGWEWFVVELMSLTAAVLFIYFTEYGAMGSFIAITPPAVCASIRLFLLYGMKSEIVPFYIVANMLIFGICFITWFAHRKNIERMLAGEEHPTSIREMIVKMREKKAAKRAEQAQKMQENTDENRSEK